MIIQPLLFLALAFAVIAYISGVLIALFASTLKDYRRIGGNDVVLCALALGSWATLLGVACYEQLRQRR